MIDDVYAPSDDRIVRGGGYAANDLKRVLALVLEFEDEGIGRFDKTSFGGASRVDPDCVLHGSAQIQWIKPVRLSERGCVVPT